MALIALGAPTAGLCVRARPLAVILRWWAEPLVVLAFKLFVAYGACTLAHINRLLVGHAPGDVSHAGALTFWYILPCVAASSSRLFRGLGNVAVMVDGSHVGDGI